MHRSGCWCIFCISFRCMLNQKSSLGWIFDNHRKCAFYIFSQNTIKIIAPIICELPKCFVVEIILQISLNPPKRWLSWYKWHLPKPCHNNASHTCVCLGIVKSACIFLYFAIHRLFIIYYIVMYQFYWPLRQKAYTCHLNSLHTWWWSVYIGFPACVLHNVYWSWGAAFSAIEQEWPSCTALVVTQTMQK